MADMNALSVSEITRDDIKSRIYTIRGVQVMLDRDIAFLYGVETRVLNQAVKRNAERFPSGYCFQLTDEEFEKWKSQIVMSNSDKMGLRRNPFAFTERGVAMLSTVLHSPAAIKMSMQIMDAFVSMRHYLADVGNSNALLLQHLERIDDKLLEHDEKINIVLNELDKYKEKNEVIFYLMLCILRVFYIGGICAAVRRIFPVEVFHGGNGVLHGMRPQVSGFVLFCSELVL